MTPTPRTDAALDHYYYNNGGSIITLVTQSRELETELTAMTTRASKAMEDYESANLRAIRAEAEIARLTTKLKRADDMLSEVWGAYNRIGDALKEKP